MLIRLITSLVPVTMLAVALPNLFGQGIVHAMVGTVTSIGPSNPSLTLKLPDQSTQTFQVKADLSTQVSFDKTLREESVSASELPKVDNNVIVYYFGLSPLVAVAVKDLGKGAVSMTGTITRADRGTRMVEIQAGSGGAYTCYLSKETTVETSSGAIDGTRYSPRTSEKVRMICAEEAGRQIAQFIQPLIE